MYILHRCKFCGWIPRNNSYEKLINHIIAHHEKEYEEILAYADRREEFEWQQEKCNVEGALR